MRTLAERAAVVGLPPPGYDWDDVRRLADALHTLALRYAVDADDADVFFDLFFDLVDRRGRGGHPLDEGNCERDACRGEPCPFQRAVRPGVGRPPAPTGASLGRSRPTIPWRTAR
jgi:hypothetical protein